MSSEITEPIQVEQEGLLVTITSNSATITGFGWSLSLPDNIFEKIVKTHGFDEDILEKELLIYYRNSDFFESEN